MKIGYYDTKSGELLYVGPTGNWVCSKAEPNWVGITQYATQGLFSPEALMEIPGPPKWASRAPGDLSN